MSHRTASIPCDVTSSGEVGPLDGAALPLAAAAGPVAAGGVERHRAVQGGGDREGQGAPGRKAVQPLHWYVAGRQQSPAGEAGRGRGERWGAASGRGGGQARE